MTLASSFEAHSIRSIRFAIAKEEAISGQNTSLVRSNCGEARVCTKSLSMETASSCLPE